MLFQCKEKRNRNIEGTGLGINITTQLLLLMGSRLQVESTYGKGSKFFFTLEQQIVDSTPVGNLEERLKKMNTEYSYMAAFTAPDAQVLVVDDNATNHKVFVSLLKCTKINVDVADSGKACLEMTAKKRYDLIFLDHMMPEMDGIETIHRLKQAENNPCERTPVIALTANAITGAKEMYLSEGFDAFLPKPINPEKLEQMILRLLPRELLLFDAEGEKEENSITTDEKQEGIHRAVLPDAEELPMVDGIDWSYGLMHLPGKELLLETVRDFCKTVDAEAVILQKFFEERNNPELLAQYRIKVHAMKSSANLIGATVLGGMAKLLENAARDGDVKRIEALHDIFLMEWRASKERLLAYIPEEQDSRTNQVELEDVSELLAYLEMLRVAMAELDMDEMDRIMEILEGISFPDELKTDMDLLAVHVTNLDSVSGEELIKSLMEKISEQSGGN